MDNYLYERKYLASGLKYIAGVDEVGRGPLAGPVVCAAVIMPTDNFIEGVNDSKKLSERKRKELSRIILDRAVCYNIAEISQEEIDRINILQAVRKCMENAVKGLTIMPDITLVDGLDTHLNINAEYIIKGDNLSYTIACASIIAKVYRDELMCGYAKEFPEYGFDKNKGYGTALHINKIKEAGPCRLHRRTFIKNFTEERGKTKPYDT